MYVKNMSFDPMATAVDWLDAYRAGDVETILDMFADDAVICCDCGGTKVLMGRKALHAYWVDRLRRDPAFEMDDLQPSSNEIRISCFTGSGLVNAVLTLSGVGQIRKLSCGPSDCGEG
ncbi:nuclear transport factor 2 family protein [Bradyrhizobium sp. RD5-C2]|uniref:YybH family protein n=1 Tax=Bradyrhizobium sp. RD5-C2 TaxID=244562 RepID=UPI001CC7D7BF|nr:nuclear transport factor 2 family protein [Bradyrhizobium sp. RD5-C2]